MDGKRICIVPVHGHPHEQRHDSIVNSDGEYQIIIWKSDDYSSKLDEMELPKEVRLLIDGYVSKQNAHSTLCY